MTRTRIESLLASFPKLIPANTQHTTFETTEVRYVYQPLEDLYILLITNKASNILQDIDTLHLFARVVSDMCKSADEREILSKAFEILGAFDEVVSMGYRENVNLMQVRNVLEMESHEEKIQEIIAKVLLLWFHKGCSLILHRTKKLRQKKNLSVGPNNSRCNAGNSNVVLSVLAEELAISVGSEEVYRAMPPCLVSMPQSVRLASVQHLPHRPTVPLVLPLSRVLA